MHTLFLVIQVVQSLSLVVPIVFAFIAWKEFKPKPQETARAIVIGLSATVYAILFLARPFIPELLGEGLVSTIALAGVVSAVYFWLKSANAVRDKTSFFRLAPNDPGSARHPESLVAMVCAIPCAITYAGLISTIRIEKILGIQ